MDVEFTAAFFDDASAEWRANKRRIKANGSFCYTCDHTYKSRKRCSRDTQKGDALCRQHSALLQNLYASLKHTKDMTASYHMLITGERVIGALKAHNISIEGVLHIGAHDCEELGFYEQLGVDKTSVYWIDALEFKVEQAKARGIPNVFQAVVTDRDDQEVTFHISNNVQSSSVLEFGTHLQYYRGIDFVHHQQLKTTTVDTFLEKQGIDPTRLHFWNFDIQGAELMALKGAVKALPFAKALYLEVNFEEVYKGCGQIQEIDTLLGEQGFTRILTAITGAGWGDALYVRS